MSVVDLRNAGPEAHAALAECDVCIVGTGPAGSALARELSKTSLRVILLESGGFERDPAADRLDDIESIGRPRVADQWAVRNRIVGGSSHTWGGRCGPFDAIDFEQRDWVPDSGWPFALADVEPYLERAAPYLGLSVARDYSDDRFWSIAGRTPPASNPDPSLLLPFFWQFSRDENESYPYEYTRFGRALASQLGPNATLVCNATVLRIETDATGKAVQSLVVADPSGRTLSVRASRIALCAGGIENARLLLVSNSLSPNGLGNENDLVGRYLMDHLRGPCGLFDQRTTDALRRRFGRYNVQGNLFLAGLRLSPDVQREERLLNCAAWLGEEVAEDDPWSAIRRFAGGHQQWPQDAITIATNLGTIARGLKQYLADKNGVPRKLQKLSLECICEQVPDRDSRITLSDRRDRFGIPLAKIDWRIHEDERRTLRRTAQLIAQEFTRMGLPAPTLAEWVTKEQDLPPEFVDVAHPTATTRMSRDPKAGVVDANGQVHGVSGLFITGTSVFPTAGHCNPTQMIVALAVRLADHLKSGLSRHDPVAQGSSAPRAETRKGKVLVTGATGRIGRVVVADLVERGYAVRAVSSKTGQPGAPAVEWRQFDLAAPGDYDDLVAGCDAVLHLAAELGNMSVMQRVNVDATRALAEAAERLNVKAFCYTSSVSVYGSGLQRTMDEGAPVLTADRDIASEYWALDYVRAYGRTKLAGELAIRDVAKTVRYTIMRPTVVVDVDAIIDVRQWNVVKRNLGAHRHAHHIYVGDVSDALIWFMEKALRTDGAPGGVEIYNLSDDEIPDPTYAHFMRRAWDASGDKRYRVVPVPGFADWLHDFLRFRTLPLRNPLWRMRFPSAKLRAAGYCHRFGMERAYAMALERLRRERAGA